MDLDHVRSKCESKMKSKSLFKIHTPNKLPDIYFLYSYVDPFMRIQIGFSDNEYLLTALHKTIKYYIVQLLC
jgi:hypothetical protein